MTMRSVVTSLTMNLIHTSLYFYILSYAHAHTHICVRILANTRRNDWIQEMNENLPVSQHSCSMSRLSIPAICQTSVRVAKLAWTRLLYCTSISIILPLDSVASVDVIITIEKFARFLSLLLISRTVHWIIYAVLDIFESMISYNWNTIVNDCLVSYL